MIIAMVSVQDDLIETTQNINKRYIIKVIFREAGFIGFCPLDKVMYVHKISQIGRSHDASLVYMLKNDESTRSPY